VRDQPPRIRPLTVGDAEPLAALLAANREFLAPFGPARDDEYFTTRGQRARLRIADAERRADRLYRYAILDDDGDLAGAIALENVVRGAAQSATVGYWVDRARNGGGLATGALDAVLDDAFGDLGLHRLQAPIRPENARSRRVVEKNGFERIGLARGYLLVDGAWRDHDLWQRLAGE
jgi:[ribosomal protein S5]-alanine N-acetyltransferase